MDITDFLTARLDEDETTAKAAAGAQVFGQIFRGESAPDPRPLREVQAKRIVMSDHWPEPDVGWADRCSCDRDYPCVILCAIAAVYSDHPDHNPAWTVDVV